MERLASTTTRHLTVCHDPHAYCAHPHAVRAADGSLVAVFNKVPRREVILHPPEDPLYQNMITRSEDEGETWSEPEPVPGYNWSGMECAGLTLLANGEILLNQWQFGWLPAGRARALPDRTGWTDAAELLARWAQSPEHDTAAVNLGALRQRMPWMRGPGRCLIHRSRDHGASFGETAEIAIAPWSGGYGMRGGVETTDGRIILPLSDAPKYRTVFTVESGDGGQSWSAPRHVASGSGHDFEEPAIVRGLGDRLILVLRDNATRHLHLCLSTDAGQSWGAPRPLPVAGYPAHLLRLGDGRLLLTYGWRQPDFGIRAVLSEDDGESWQAGPAIAIRRGMKNGNLGYPVTLERRDGTLISIYYGEDAGGTTTIQATIWDIGQT